MSRPCVLNVGGGSKAIGLPPHYEGWEHLLLDIYEREDVDVVCDARELGGFPRGLYDAVYCSHNLEHYHRHEVPQVLSGFLNVLKDDGFCEIRVPDLRMVMQAVLDRNLSLEEPLYQSASGPITPLDVFYGYGREVATGNPWYAHKTGFTPETLAQCVTGAGFTEVWIAPPYAAYEARVVAFRRASSEAQKKLFGLSA